MLWLSGAAVLLGYLLGSLPTAYLAARRAARAITDIRRLGDGNPGAGNIGRLLGRRWGILVGAVDIAKGAVPVFAVNLLAGILVAPDGGERAASGPGMLAGVSAVAGHIWPVWLHWRGGRGAATVVGVTGAVLTGPVLLTALPAAAILLSTRSTTLTLAFVYITSVVAAKAFFGAAWGPVCYCIALFLAVGVAHFWTVKFRVKPEPVA